MSNPKPPEGYETWLDWCVDNTWRGETDSAARAELAELRRERDAATTLLADAADALEQFRAYGGEICCKIAEGSEDNECERVTSDVARWCAHCQSGAVLARIREHLETGRAGTGMSSQPASGSEQAPDAGKRLHADVADRTAKTSAGDRTTRRQGVPGPSSSSDSGEHMTSGRAGKAGVRAPKVSGTRTAAGASQDTGPSTPDAGEERT